ncbi:T surface-antigen of pili [Lachnospiraceae bacterium NE2001]|nr:T surface-antigen of pili [Lachnospiraceae bacterium NE2001]
MVDNYGRIKIGMKRKVLALFMALAMVLSLIMPYGVGTGVKAVSQNAYLVDITSLVNANVSQAPTSRNSSFAVDITYTIPQDKYNDAYDSSYDEIIWIYDLSQFINQYPELSSIVDKNNGAIVEGNTDRGTYTISENKVYLNVDRNWLESVIHPTGGESSPASISGTFSMDVTLDEKSIGSKDNISFKFPGAQADTTLSFPSASTVSTSKGAVGKNNDSVAVTPNGDGTYNVKYNVVVTPSTYENASFHVFDTLNNDKQKFVADSFSASVGGQIIDLSNYTSINGQVADVNLFAAMQDNNKEITAGNGITISYSTTIPASELGSSLVNSVYPTWGADNKSTDPVTETVKPKTELSVQKVLSTVSDSEKIFKYTITIGDSSTDLSGLTIVDNMKDLQRLVGDIKLNGTVISPTNNTFTDTNYYDNVSELFKYVTSDSYGTGPITIEYNVQIPKNEEAPNIDGTRTLTNEVTASNDKYTGTDDVAFNNDFEEIGVGSLTKEFVSFDSTTNKVNWKLTVSNTGDNALQNAYITETASANTLNNIYDFQPGNAAIDWTSLVVKDANGNAVPSTDYNVVEVPNSSSRNIVFNSIPAKTTYTIELSSTPTSGNLVNGVTYRNNAVFKNKNDSVLDSKQVDKLYEDTSGTLTVNKSYIYNKEDKTYDWVVVINENKTIIKPDQALYFIDELPEGMEYVDGTMIIKANGTNSKGYTFWDYTSSATPSISGNKIGPIDVSDVFTNTWIGAKGYVGISGVCTSVMYKTKLSDAELAKVKGSTTTQSYSNTFKVTDSTGTNVIAEDTDTAFYDYKFLTKTDLTDSVVTDADNIRFCIDVNPDALTLNNGSPLTLKDNLSTSIELVTNNTGSNAFTITDANGTDLLASGDATLSYNDDNRLISMTIPDSTHVIVKYTARTRGVGTIQVDNSAELSGDSSIDSDKTSEEHKVSHHSATIGAGSLRIHKIDEHNIFKELSDAKFDVYKVDIDSQNIITGDTRILKDVPGSSGYYYFDSSEFAEGTIFYWVETKAPNGYLLDSTPHYFVFYSEDDTVALDQNPSYIAADKLDDAVSKANNITIAKIPFAYTWTVCNKKDIEEKGSFSVTKSLSKADTLAASYFTDTVKSKEFSAVVTLEVPAGKNAVTGAKTIATGKTADFSLVSGSTTKSSATVSIKDGDVFTFGDLPIGTTYTVTESDLSQSDKTLGYEKGSITGGTNNDGTGSIQNSTSVSTVTLNNLYNPKGSVTVTKKFVSPSLKSDTFYFALYSVVVPQNETLVPGSAKSISNLKGSATGTTDTVTWTDVPYGTYKVYETDSLGAKLDDTYKYTVTNNGISIDVNKATVDAGAIRNTETPTGDLEVSKTVVSSTASDKTKDFSFTVTLDDTSISGTYGGMSFTNGVATFTLKDGEKKTATGLPQTVGYTVTETAADGFVTTQTGSTGTISATKSEAKFTNTKQEGGLAVTKTVVSDMASDSDKEFDFTVTLNDNTINGTYGGMTFTNGVATFSLKNGESASSTGLPEGVTYTVVETEDTGFTTTKSGDTGTISSTTPSTATFTNTRKTGNLNVEKILVSDLAADSNEEFEFTVTLGDNTITGTYGDITFTNGIATFKLKGGQSKSATGLPESVTYTVTETSNTEFTTSKIGDTGSISSQDAKTAAFTNTRKTGDLEVSKSVESSTASDKDKDFSFTVTLSDTTISGTYGGMTFTKGVATFTLKDGEKRTATGLPQTVGYTVTETAVDGFATTKTGDTGTISDTKSEAKFTNTKEGGNLSVSKALVSDLSSDKDQQFDFTVTLGDNTINGTFGGMTFTNGVATFSLKGGESKSATNLPDGVSYTVTEANVNGFINTGKTGDTGTISSGDTSEAVFTNTRETGNLKVSKTVSSSKDVDFDKEFNFKVSLNDTGISGTYGDMSFTNGVSNFTLKNGESKTAFGLPQSVQYTVEEASVSNCTTTKTGDSGSISNALSEAKFTNTFSYPTVVKVSKIDVENGRQLYGAVIQVIDSTGDIAKDVNGDLIEWVSTTEPHEVVGLSTGETYKLRETVAPEGYAIASESLFKLKSDGTIDAIATTATFDNDGILYVEDAKTKVKISKVDITSGDEVEGAHIQILDATGNIVKDEQGNNIEWDSTTTSKEIVGLKTGVTYTLRETVAPDGYAVSTDTYFKLKDDGSIDTNESTTKVRGSDGALLVEDAKTKVKISKVDITSGEEVAGAHIQILDEQGNVVKDASGGNIEWDSTTTPKEIEGLKTGVTYTLRETVAPDGYTVTTDTTFKLKADGTIDTDATTTKVRSSDGALLVEDTKTSVKISKVDITSGDEVAGAHIQILDATGNIVKDEKGNNIEWDSTTTPKEIVGLKTGVTYTLRETVAPDGYAVTTDTTFMLDADGKITTTGTISTDGTILVEDAKTSVKISKVDITSGDEVEGAHIQILDASGNVVKDASGANIEWDSTTTPKEIVGLKTGVTYTLRETVAPDGYAVTTDTTFSLKDDGTVDTNSTTTKVRNNDGVLLVEDAKTSVKISKVDVTNEKELAGAHIQILDEQGNVVKDASGATIEWDSTTTPHEINGLKTGVTYTLRETVAPNGYQITTDTTFTLDIYGNVDASKTTTTQNATGVLLVEDWPQGSIVLNKEGLLNETCSNEPSLAAPLNDVEFTITKVGDAAFKPVTSVSDKDGIVTFTNLDAGTYNVTETKTVGEYVLDTNTYTAEIDSKGNYSGLKDSKGNAVAGNKLTNDLYRGDIEFVKVNLDKTDEVLPGSTYGLYISKGDLYSRTGKTLGTGESKTDLVKLTQATTDSKGRIKFEGVLTNVEYTVQEEVAPSGYYVSEKPIKLKLTKTNNGSVQMSMVNDGNGTVKVDANGNITWLEPEVKVSFLKTDEAGKPLAGAKLKVVDDNGKDVISWTSTDSAYEVDGKFVSGKTYKLVETEAPSGYELAEPVSFSIAEKAGEKGADVIKVEMKDKKTPEKSETPSKPTEEKETSTDKQDTTDKKDTTTTPGTPSKSTEEKNTTTTPGPSAPSTPEKQGTTVNTGDSNPIIPVAILLVIAFIGIIGILILKKKEK